MPGRRLYTLHPPLARHRRAFLSLPRSHRSGYLLRKDLHFQKENKSQHFSASLAGQAVGIKEVDDGIWLVTFMDYDLGYIDLEERTLQPLTTLLARRCTI